MKSRLVLLMSLAAPASALWNIGSFCLFEEDRCWFGFGKVMHYSGDSCRESCILFPFVFLYPHLECGACSGKGVVGASIPGPTSSTTPSPTRTPATGPTSESTLPGPAPFTTASPTNMPTTEPIDSPTISAFEPSPGPTPQVPPTISGPSPSPTATLSNVPTANPTDDPTQVPTQRPTTIPTMILTADPTTLPKISSTSLPTSPDPKSSYNIAYGVSGDFPLDVEERFVAAIQKWESVIIGDQPDVTYSSTTDRHGCTFPKDIDDVYICAAVDSIPSDGPGQVVGWGGYFRRRGETDGLPTMSFISLDSADTHWFTLPILIHEIGHGLGFGTLWATQGLGAREPSCPFSGARANAAYRALSGCDTNILVEQDTNRGAECGHWDEACFGLEVMTGVANGGFDLPLSTLTVASMEDIGYEVNYDNADYYDSSFLDTSVPGCVCNVDRNLRQVSKKTPVRRQLSREAYDIAYKFGLDFLEKNSLDAPAPGSPMTRDAAGNNEVNLDDQMVTVWVEDDGAVFDVVVTREQY